MTLASSLVALAILQAPADSPGATVGVPPLAIEGELAGDVRDAFAQRVDERLDATSVARADLDDAECNDLDCQRSQAQAAGANVILRVTVGQNQRDYTIRSEIISTSSGEVVRKDENYCEICTYDEALETLTQQIDNIKDPLAQAIAENTPGAPLVVTSQPVAAVVSIDGAPAGKTPYNGELSVGQHTLGLQLDGYRAVERDLEVADLEPISLDFKLRRADKVSIKEAAGWGLVGVAVPMLVSGIVLIAIDENPHKASCTGTSKDVNGTCEFRYNTLGAGIGLTVGGVLAGAGGAVLIVLDRKERGMIGGKNVKASAFLTPTGAGIRGRFRI